jgi:hypothetical protein
LRAARVFGYVPGVWTAEAGTFNTDVVFVVAGKRKDIFKTAESEFTSHNFYWNIAPLIFFGKRESVSEI